MRILILASYLAISSMVLACASAPLSIPEPIPIPTTTQKIDAYTYEVVHSFPHDPEAYTQGLVFFEGEMLESTGRYGQSSLRRVDFRTGKVLQKVDVSSEYFAEGMTILDGKIFQLTWKEQKGFVYDLKTLGSIADFAYRGEGWGLTTDGTSLIMSDGSNQIRFLDPQTFHLQRTISVLENNRPLMNLNELEYIKGEIFANIWQKDRIVRIDPSNGRLIGTIDMSGLIEREKYDQPVDVLNGIAYDAPGDRLFVTGKLWPKLYEIRLKKK
jgi:glutaminyl-peptide cyclotransferase